MSSLKARIDSDKMAFAHEQRQHSLKIKEYSEAKERQGAIMQEYAMKVRQANEMRSMKEEIQKQLKSAEKEKSPFGPEINIAEARMDAEQQKLNNMEEAMKTGRAKLEFFKETLKWLGTKGIPTYIMDNVIRQIEVNMTKWCARLFVEEDVLIRLDHAPDGTLIKRIEVGGVKATLSGGQYRRIQIAAWWALRDAAICRSGIDNNIVIFDEATHSLDVTGVDCLHGSLREWCNEDHRRSVLMVTHERAQFKDTSAYDHMICVKRSGNESTIIIDGKSSTKKLKLKRKAEIGASPYDPKRAPPFRHPFNPC